MHLRRPCTIWLFWLLSAPLFVGGSHLGVMSDKSAFVVPPSILTPESNCKEVASWMPRDFQSPLLLQVVSEPYLRLQHNFFIVMQKNTKFPIDSVYLVCLDKESVRYLDAHLSFRCVEAESVPPYPGVWTFRTLLLTCLVKEGFDVIMSDNDVLWLRDPRPELSAIKGDVVVQRGSMPLKFAEPVYGTTLCMGFAFFRAGSAGMPMFLNSTFRATIQYEDDQWGINAAASRLHIKWDYNRSTSDMRKFTSTELGFGIVTDLPGRFTVTYLPNSLYSRNCHQVPMSEDGVVAHCFPHPHEPHIKKQGLWYLD